MVTEHFQDSSKNKWRATLEYPGTTSFLRDFIARCCNVNASSCVSNVSCDIWRSWKPPDRDSEAFMGEIPSQDSQGCWEKGFSCLRQLALAAVRSQVALQRRMRFRPSIHLMHDLVVSTAGIPFYWDNLRPCWFASSRTTDPELTWTDQKKFWEYCRPTGSRDALQTIRSISFCDGLWLFATVQFECSWILTMTAQGSLSMLTYPGHVWHIRAGADQSSELLSVQAGR
jgi:hypothetical protein